jgi:hypothetical protein
MKRIGLSVHRRSFASASAGHQGLASDGSGGGGGGVGRAHGDVG